MEVLIVSFLGVLLAIPVGQFFTSFIDGFMKIYILFYAPSFDVIMFVSIGLLTVFTAIIATIPAVRKLRRIDIDRVIRERIMT